MTDLPARAAQRLEAGDDPLALIARLTPDTPALATAAARRLALLGQSVCGPRAVGIARLATLRGMRRFGLCLTEEGRVEQRNPRRPVPSPTRHFACGEAQVGYIAGYYPGTDHFQFTGPGATPRVMAFSGSAWWSHFAPADAVAAVGGPEEYARRYVAAKLDGRADEFERGFADPEVGKGRKKAEPVADDPPVEETHAAKVVAERVAKVQRSLF